MPVACSIVVATRNRPEPLRDLLDCLARLDDRDLEVEVVVVNDGDDTSVRVTDRLPSRFSVRVAELPHLGPGAARNRGARLAAGQLLVFTDDDCRPDGAWLQAYAAAHRRQPTALLGGATVTGFPANRWSVTSEVIVRMARRFYNDRAEGPTFFPSNNMAVPAIEFARLGGFDPRYRFASEDRDLCDRWRHAGLPLAEVADARVVHAHELSFPSFARQHLAYGRGAWKYHGARRERGSGRLASDLRFQPRLPELFCSTVPRGRRARLLWPLAVWQVANLSGFLAAAWSQARGTAAEPRRGERPSDGRIGSHSRA